MGSRPDPTPAPGAARPGAGLGLRRALLDPLIASEPAAVDLLELAPENWIGVGGGTARQLRELAERAPLFAHGLSLSLGGPAPLDRDLIAQIDTFLFEHGIAHYSEHLSWCADDAHLYELLPLPFSDEAVRWVAARIRQVQDLLGRRIAVENVSYYAAPPTAAPLGELEFVRAVLSEADCDLLLDVNNVYVNSFNHGGDADAFIDGLPGERIAWLHVAGHHREAPDLLVDTHGAAVIDPVWRLLARAYARFGVRPTVLERDFDLPPLAELLDEIAQVRALQSAAMPAHADVA